MAYTPPSYGDTPYDIPKSDNSSQMDTIDLSSIQTSDLKSMSLGGKLELDKDGNMSTVYGKSDNPIINKIMDHMDNRNKLTEKHDNILAGATGKSGYWNDSNTLHEIDTNIKRERRAMAGKLRQIDESTVKTLSSNDYASALDASVTSNDWNPNINAKESISTDILLRQAATKEITNIMSAKDPETIARLIDEKVNNDAAKTQALSGENRNVVINSYKQKYPELFTPEAIAERNKQADNVLQNAAEKEPRVDVRNPFAVESLLNQTSREQFMNIIKAETDALNVSKNTTAAKSTQATSARFASTSNSFSNYNANDKSTQLGD